MAVILNQANRGPGTITVSGSAAGATPATNYVATALMDAVDVADATLAIPIRLFLDTRQVWIGTWQGGLLDRAGNPLAPVVQYSCPETPPAQARLEADLPKRIRFGWDLTLGTRT